MGEDRRLLAAYAHPDDEAFGTAGVLARSAAEGVSVRLVCATRGEEGEIAPGTLDDPATLPEAREEELRCSCRQIGIGEPLLLGYRDSGMAGTSANEKPEAFCNAAADEVVGRLVAIIRQQRPQVVITFDPTGGYGHPDHMAIHRHTLAACEAAGDASRFVEAGPAWQVKRVFWMTFPREMLVEMVVEMKAQGADTSDFDLVLSEGTNFAQEEPVAAVIDVADYIDAKWAAIGCHKTQLDPNGPWRAVPEAVLRRLLAREYYVLGWPPGQAAPHLPWSDLFEGLGD
ncbi:MAG: PIG-L family deacetylase [Chloroflexota bacterium]